MATKPEMLSRIESHAIALAHGLQMDYGRRDTATMRAAKEELAKSLARFLRQHSAECGAEDVLPYVSIEWRNTGHGTRLAPIVSPTILELFRPKAKSTPEPVAADPEPEPAPALTQGAPTQGGVAQEIDQEIREELRAQDVEDVEPERSKKTRSRKR